MVFKPYTVEKLLRENAELRRQRQVLAHALVERGEEGTKPVTGFQFPPPAKGATRHG